MVKKIISKDQVFDYSSLQDAAVRRDAKLPEKGPYTIVEHSKQIEAVIKLSMRHYPKLDARELVALNPARMILHEIMVQLQTRIQQELSPEQGEFMFNQMVRTVIETVGLHDRDPGSEQLDVSRTILRLNSEYTAIQTGVHLLLENDEHQAATVLTPEEITTAKKMISDQASTSFTEQDKTACFHRVISKIYADRSQKLIEPMVSKYLDQTIQQQGWRKLTYQPIRDSIAIFTVGGPGSGKTSTLSQLAKVVDSSYAIPWSNLSHHNTDRLRQPLMDLKSDAAGVNRRTADEARMVKVMEMSRLMARYHHDHQAPHEVYDTPVLKTDDVRHSAGRKQNIICVVSTDTDKAIDRAYSRGKEEHRHVELRELLAYHKKSAESFVNELVHADGTNTTVVMFDNNQRPPVVFATIDMMSKKIMIIDEAMMNKWIAKCDIGEAVFHSDGSAEVELPTEPLSRNVDDYFRALTGSQLGYTIERLTPEQAAAQTNSSTRMMMSASAGDDASATTKFSAT